MFLEGLGTELRWTLPQGSVQYELMVAPFNGDGPGINLIRNAENGFSIKAPSFGGDDPNYTMLPDMTYTWQVRSTSDGVQWSAWSLSTFRTGKVGSGTITRAADLAWTNSDKQVFYYEVQVSKDPGFGKDAFLYWELVHGGATAPANTYRVPSQYPLEANTLYHWRVRPRIQGDGDEVAWSEVWRFRTP